MNTRPGYIIFISWFFIVTGAFSFLTSFVSMNSPLVLELMAKNLIPDSARFALMCVGLTISIASGVFMLRGVNWTRFLYVIWGTIGFLSSLATFPVKLMLAPGIIVYGIIIILLFNANTRKILSIISLVGSSFFLHNVIWMAFFQMLLSEKLVMIGMLLIPTLLTLLIGFGLRSFTQWQKICSRVFLYPASFSGLLFLFFFYTFYFQRSLQSKYSGYAVFYFSDVIFGFGFLSLVLLSGIVLFYKGRSN